MMYLAERNDGSVAVVTVFPIGAVSDETGHYIAIQGFRPRGEAMFLFGTTDGGGPWEEMIGAVGLDIGELRADSLHGYTLQFPDFMADILPKWPPKHRDRVVSSRPVTRAEIPADRTFRNAWRSDGAKIDHDMPAAREIHLERVRRARARKLEALDREWSRANGRGVKKEADAIEARREELRNLPATLDVESAATVDELKTRWSPLLD